MSANFVKTSLSIRPCTTPDERLLALGIRQRVFVEEQGVPAELEIDEHDAASTAFLAFAGDTAVGTGRFRPYGEAVKFERIATLAACRGHGVGKALMAAMEADASRRYPGRQLYMHAQLSAATFYDALGWQRVGDVFTEADIEHVVMIKQPSNLQETPMTTKPKKTVCPISRAEFLEKAQPLSISIDNVPMSAPPREFSTGSLGWNLNNKTVMDIGGTKVTVQIGMNITLVGSKDLPGKAAAPAEGEGE